MPSNSSNRTLALIYAATIFVSAFLLFQIQPMISKAILPWFGGTPAVWTTCLLFFQSLLFVGYAYAHFSNTWLSRRQQAIVHIVLIVFALALLRVIPTANQQPAGDADPTRAILTILAFTIGLPYLVLSATGPLLQAWFADAFPNRTPYRLYALSNVGSLLALLSYPFLFERAFELPGQGRMWSASFIAFGLLCGYIALRVYLSPKRTDLIASNIPASSSPISTESAPTPPRSHHYLLWLLLPAFASATLMATTNHVSTDVAVVPLLWVVPLALYLVTFIIAFDRSGWYFPLVIAGITLVSIYAASVSFHKNNFGKIDIYGLGMTGRTVRSLVEYAKVPTKSNNGDSLVPHTEISFSVALAANFLAMFGVCLLCHGELTRLKPHKRYLTAFYLMIAAGGALGGIAISVIAPHVFRTMLEWKLTSFAAAIASIALILYALVGRCVSDVETSTSSYNSLYARIALVVLLFPTAFILLDLVEYLFSPRENVVYQSRNFFGAITIRQDKEKIVPEGATESKEGNPYALILLNGTTVHGSQFLAPKRRGDPTSYYAETSGIGQVLNFFHRNRPPGGLRIGDVGLGTGTLAAYALKGDYLTFYEINPDVIDIATSGEWFTYVADCKARGAKCDVKLGDARLMLESETKIPNLPRYHVLVLDAFSSDAIPTHLLTLEACKNYLPRIATEAVDGADGALIIHVSNRHLDLSRVVRKIAEELDLTCLDIRTDRVPDQLINRSDWMVLTRNPALIAALKPFDFKPDAEHPLKPPVLWTDARSSLFEILK